MYELLLSLFTFRRGFKTYIHDIAPPASDTVSTNPSFPRHPAAPHDPELADRQTDESPVSTNGQDTRTYLPAADIDPATGAFGDRDVIWSEPIASGAV